MILLWYILIPAVAAPLAWLLARSRPQAARWVAVAGTALPLALVTWQWVSEAGALRAAFAAHGPGVAGLVQGTWLADVQAAWISPLGISFFLAEDGLTLIMLVLTFAMGLLAVPATATQRAACGRDRASSHASGAATAGMRMYQRRIIRASPQHHEGDDDREADAGHADVDAQQAVL